MTDPTATPYIDADLRAEAARQHATLATDPDYMGVGEQMEGQRIPSTDDGLGGMGWDGLPNEHYDTAQRKIHDLINGAADVSEWAVNLGADGLEPSPHEITLDNADGAFVRLHLAFHPSMPEHDRKRFTDGVKQAIANSI